MDASQAAHATDDDVKEDDDVKAEDESTPPWLQSAVDKLAAEMVTERQASASGSDNAAPVATAAAVGLWPAGWRLLLILAPVVFAVLYATLAPSATLPESTASASEGSGVALAVSGAQEQQMLGALSRRAASYTRPETTFLTDPASVLAVH